MMTILLRSQTLASLPNSRLKTPMVPGPQTSWVINTSAWTQTLSPDWTRALPAARARIFSVKVIVQSNLADFRGWLKFLSEQGQAPGAYENLREVDELKSFVFTDIS